MVKYIISEAVMIIGLGTDLVENERIKSLYLKYNSVFLNKVFSKHEIDYSFSKKEPYSHLAVRWAAKEAFWKALNTDKMLRPLWLEIVKSSVPEINILFSELTEILEEKSVDKIHLSMSHEKLYSSSVVILEGGLK